MRRILATMVVCLLLAACGGGDSDKTGNDALADLTGDVVAGDVATPDVVVGPNALLPPPLTLQSFTVVVAANQTSVTVGQAVELTARHARGVVDGELTYAWELDGAVADGATDGTTLVATLPEAGRYAISVTATDGAGEAATAGVLVQAYAADATYLVGDVDDSGTVDTADHELLLEYLTGAATLTVAQMDRGDLDLNGRVNGTDAQLLESLVNAETAPGVLWPAVIYVGQKGQVIDPVLLDPGAAVTLAVNGQDIPFYRGRPGYATFILPPDAEPGQGSLELAVDGTVAATYEFDEILALPEGSGSGERVLKAFALLDETLAYMPPMIATYLDTLEVSGDERAVMLGMLEVALDSMTTHRAAFEDAFNRMDDAGRAGFESVALANGLDDVIGELEGLLADLQNTEYADQISVGAAATIMQILCAAINIADISEQVAEINDIASGYIGWFDWWPLNTAPIVGQVITFLSNLSNAIGAITDIIGIVAEYLPEFGDLTVQATPGTLNVGDSATIKVSITIVIATKLCAKAADKVVGSLMDIMNEKLTNRLGSAIPLVGNAFKAAKFDKEKMGTVVGLIYDAISGIVGAVLDAIGVESLLNSLAEAVCSLVSDPTLPMDPELAKASCGTNSGGSWTCTEACVGAQTFDVKTEVCGEKKEGSAGATCVGCDENNCGAGCCDSGNCVLYASQNTQKCGTGAAACAACPEHHECVNGVCTCSSTCDNAGDKQCQGNSVYVCNVVVANPECRKWQKDEDCINGAECKNGVCEGGCHSENCEGCCLGDGTCITEVSTDHCGKNGETCSYCAGGYDQCINGECTCVPDCTNFDCGDDGCGGSCGLCEADEYCTPLKVCEPLCGNGDLDDGEECEDDVHCDGELVCKNCSCQEKSNECACQDDGATLTPGTGGCNWPDATECTGWHSVAMENGVDYEGTFPDGTEFCAYGCCIKLNCP